MPLRHALVCAAAIASASLSAAESPEQRNVELSRGYAALYDAAKGLRWLDELLLLKFESDDTQRVLTDLARYASRLKGELEKVAKDHPSLSLDDDGLPQIERRKRALQQRDRVKTLAPVTGAVGSDFERTLLLTQSGAINQLRFLASALAEAEKGSPRHAWILGVEREFDRHYVAVVRLLDRRFFCQGAQTPTGAAGKSEGRPN
jgi:hypothetical protein